MDLLESQIKAALVLQDSRVAIIQCVKRMVDKYSSNALVGAELYSDLIALIDTSAEFGKLNYLHETLLKDDQTNTQEED